ncbi:hypothetical protein ABK040_007837 [Willaertia magna]
MSKELLRFYESGVVSGSLDEVWKIVGSFNNLPAWHSEIKGSIIEDNQSDNKIGCIRNLTLTQGGESVREKLLAFDELNHSYTYTILSGLPFENYISTLRLLPITESNQTFVDWKTEFYCIPEEKEQCTAIAKGVYTSGIASLKKVFQK